ncbi:Na+/Pi-cotransporter [Candidatus Izimaplasma bacterium HR1]|jgi:phosphate:Na+ symporter|uniref:Na/Pi cotransporter family protein n=1 Tax=Candidatus Izimoplasma sp. HR1 TaxID=1541959 RepID=UPI0004F71D7A|nr:Na+/Pi-cotransporter [Candidatus Izimaplasma bacterium HR1]
MTKIKRAHGVVREFLGKYKAYIWVTIIAILVVVGYFYAQILEEQIPEIDWKTTFFSILGGLGIFLYGINLMGDSLKALAGNKLKLIIEKTTNTPIKGILVGIIITGLIQSSSGTTALTVGLVRAGLMTLPQAVGIIIGANIGTTVTSFLLGLKIKEYALPIMAAGAFLIFFTQRKRYKQLGGVLLGFGMLFYGLDEMGGALKQLAKLDQFKAMLSAVGDTPFLGLMAGAGTTALVQSSSATIGILQSLYSTGSMELIGAVAILFGNNIGTTVTAVLASLGGSIAAKRTAAAHVLFNLIGSLMFMLFLVPYTKLIAYLEITILHNNNPEMTISFAHMGFNIVNTFIMFWFINQLVWLVKFLVRGEDGLIEVDVDSLDDKLIQEAPILALESAKMVVINMGKVAQQMFDGVLKYSFDNNKKYFENGMQIEEMLDTIDKKAHDYLVKISQADLDKTGSSNQAAYVDTIRDFERIGDHCTNLYQFFEMRHEDKVELSPEARKELEKLYAVVKETLELTVEAFDTQSKETSKRVMDREDVINRLVIKNRKRHIMRINNRQSSETQDEMYVDILSNIERIGDHCNNIVINVVQEYYYNEELDYEFND